MRLAYVMGSNGPIKASLSPLKFARKDADRMKDVLSGPRCGFEVIFPEANMKAFAVKEQLFHIAETCKPDDVLICYFSGHGILEKGSLLLMWDNTDLQTPFTTTLPVSDIMQAFKICPADNKFLILDCCHAGAAANMVGFKDGTDTPVNEMGLKSENHYVLMASGRLEKARELESLEGSFMTSSISLALGEKFFEADRDHDGRLSIQDLKSWLELKAKDHNLLYPEESVPIPSFLGQQKGGFYLTVGTSDWVPYEIPWVDASIMVILPTRLGKDTAVAISKYPITNAQYRAFIEEIGGQEIVGEHKIDGKWQGPFYPWREQDFQGPDLPVVCVSYIDAQNYCNWVNSKYQESRRAKEGTGEWLSYDLDESKLEDSATSIGAAGDNMVKLPSTKQWDFAAFGDEFPSRRPETWLGLIKSAHFKAAAPAAIDREGKRSMIRGISDLLGNVWEWTSVPYFEGAEPEFDMVSFGVPDIGPQTELRGGGFLDNLTRVMPFYDVYRLPDGVNTRHSDIGFRTTVEIPLRKLPEEMKFRLSLSRPLRDGNSRLESARVSA